MLSLCNRQDKMSGTGLTNQYVESVGKKILKRINFLGVFPCDIQPTIKHKKFSLIFNTGDSSSKGEHFVAIFAHKKTFYYFDSFGKKPTDYNITNFINNAIGSRRLIINCITIQADTSTFCGYFCLGFLLAMDRKLKFYPQFHKCNLIKNNDVIVKFIIHAINKK